MCNFDRGQYEYEEHFCEFVKYFRFESIRWCHLKIFPIVQQSETFEQFGRGPYAEQLCEIIFNMD